ncbi:MAG: protein kinase [Deltaproteobacteria bacterium]|nr:protein kinase [Deltaproteobacteria bacterium]
MAEGSSQRLPAPFGKYLLTQMIAVGGMAEVYRAKIFGASGFEKEMVVKRILPRYARNPNFVQMLIDEAKIAVSFSHGNIVPIYELGEFEGSYYIAMEFVEGRTVLDVLRDAHSKRHPLPWPYCLGVGADVAKGLAYAHSRTGPDGRPLGLVHRDINPRNIVITPAGEVKILDFGIARASTKRHQTASGVIKGTPGYMSPEQMYGHSVDARSDIYCLGILIYELLTLRRLFPVWDVNEMRAVFEAGPIPLPSTIARHVAKDVDAVIMRALTQDIDKRFQNAAEFEEELRTVIARSGTAVTASGLAREVKAIDEAPGPAAPRTAPPVVDSSGDGSSEQGAARMRSAPPSSPQVSAQASPPPSAAPPYASALPRGVPAPNSGLPQVARSSPTAPERRSTSSVGGAAASVPANAVPPKEDVGPKTQPMPLPHAPAAPLDASHSFVISLAEPSKAPTEPIAPLPQLSLDDVSHGHRTQVLAQNSSVGWAAQIGDDAELLALMKATGAHPSAGRRSILIAAGVFAVALIVLFAFFGDSITRVVKRAVSGQKAEPGVLILKTIPSGAEVTVDGKVKGKTNIKLTGYDTNDAHRIVIKPAGQDPIIVEITKADFKEGEDGWPTYLLERDYTKKDEPTPPPP